MHLRFSIATIMFVILLVSASLTLLIRPSELGASILFTILILLILVATLVVLSRRTEGLKGFVVFSIAYITITGFYYSLPKPIWIHIANEVHVLVYHPMAQEREDFEYQHIGFGEIYYSHLRYKSYHILRKTEDFDHICRMLICPLFGLLGAGVGKYVSRLRPETQGIADSKHF
jgi:hypothetical protein